MEEYPDFEKTCGYGDVTGILGANCRHNFTPFIPGVMERTYTDEQLANIDPPPFEYEGKKYTHYEATQKQREIERTIRKWERREAAAATPEDKQACQIRIRRLKQKYNEFSKAANLRTQPERMKAYVPKNIDKTAKGDIMEREKWRNVSGGDDRAAVDDVVGTKEYERRIAMLGENRSITNVITYQARKTLWRRNGTEYEDLVFVNSRDGKCLAQRSQNNPGEVVATDAMKEAAKRFPGEIIAIHNHPHSMLPSYADLKNARLYKYGVVLCHNGAVIKYSVSDHANLGVADNFLNFIQDRFEKKKDLAEEMKMLEELGVRMEVFY